MMGLFLQPDSNNSFQYCYASLVEQLYPARRGVGRAVRPAVGHYSHSLLLLKPVTDDSYRVSKPSTKPQEPSGATSLSVWPALMCPCTLCSDRPIITSTSTCSTFAGPFYLRTSHHTTGSAAASPWPTPCHGPPVTFGLVPSPSYFSSAAHRMVRSRPHAACFLRCPSLHSVLSSLSFSTDLAGRSLHQEVKQSGDSP
ncbi:hypothetical protein TNCT_685561 [Trichonephila clavata]|uniref:Uncharacterized protein n=1 Tax=Trichonephila clavata TaxID=2740835 RepID=A0A8X6GZG2_TRICU|nr:hypothetical protein TNCT_685561 [Trichonephila clavata]